MPYDQNARPKDAVRQSFEATLRNLHQGSQWTFSGSIEEADQTNKKRAWLDSYLLHSPLNTLEETLEAWSAMEQLVEEGRVRFIGYSSTCDDKRDRESAYT